jgi:hypothetical protein
MMPQIRDGATPIVAHNQLRYDLPKQINDHTKVVEIKGTYMGNMASIGFLTHRLQIFVQA